MLAPLLVWAITSCHPRVWAIPSPAPARPVANLSFSANWSQHITGQGWTIHAAIAADPQRLLFSSTSRSPGQRGGTLQTILDFNGHNGTWPFEQRCVARPDDASRRPACFVGPSAVPQAAQPCTAADHFRRQFDRFLNLSFFERHSIFAGAGVPTPAGTPTQLWRALHAPAHAAGPDVSTTWTVTTAGAFWAVDTNLTVTVPMPGTEHRYMWLNGSVTPAVPGSCDVPAQLACTAVNDSNALQQACRAALLLPPP